MMGKLLRWWRALWFRRSVRRLDREGHIALPRDEYQIVVEALHVAAGVAMRPNWQGRRQGLVRSVLSQTLHILRAGKVEVTR
jgi:hypothetical protein